MPDGEHHVVAGQHVVHEPALPVQVAREQPMVLWEADTAGERLLPDRAAQALGQGDHGVPVLRLGRAHDQRRRLGARQEIRQLLDLRSRHRVGAQHPRRRTRGELVGRLEPVAHRHNDQRRTASGHGLVPGAGDRPRHVLGTARQLAPHRVLAGQPLQCPPGEERLEGDLPAVLLADHDDQGGAAVAGVGDRVDRVAQAGGGMKVDEGRLAAGQGISRGHPHHRSLVQPEHEVHIGGKIGQEGDLGRARVAEDRGQTVPAHHVEGGVANGPSADRLAVAVALPRGGFHARAVAHRG